MRHCFFISSFLCLTACLNPALSFFLLAMVCRQLLVTPINPVSWLVVRNSLVCHKERCPSQRVQGPTAPPKFCTSVDKGLTARAVSYRYFITIFSVTRCVTRTANGRTVILILIGINSDLEFKLEVTIWRTTDFGEKQCEIKQLWSQRSIFIRYTFFFSSRRLWIQTDSWRL